jgi:hypothetical protein
VREDPVVFDNPVLIGDLDLGPQPSRWRKVELMFRHAVRVRDRRDGALITSRRVDESRAGGHRLYAGAERHLSAAWDCHAALPVVLNQHGATQSAMWTLLRGQFECSFYALWLLDPTDSAERVLRGIQLEWLSSEQSRKYYSELLDDSEFPINDEDRARHRAERQALVAEHDRTYAAECLAVGKRWKKPPDVDVTRQLGSLSTIPVPAKRLLLRHVWRSLAGLQHGDIGALLRVSDRTEAEPTTGGQMLRLSPNDQAFQNIAGMTAALTMEALHRYAQCHQAQTSDPIDLEHAALFRRRWSEV